MDLLALLNGLVAQLADAQKAADDLAKLKFDEGFAAGVASVPVGSDKIFSQEEVDAMLKPLQDELALVKEQVLALQGEIDTKVAEAVAGFKAELLAKYEAQQVVESDSETGFRDLLK